MLIWIEWELAFIGPFINSICRMPLLTLEWKFNYKIDTSAPYFHHETHFLEKGKSRHEHRYISTKTYVASYKELLYHEMSLPSYYDQFLAVSLTFAWHLRTQSTVDCAANWSPRARTAAETQWLKFSRAFSRIKDREDDSTHLRQPNGITYGIMIRRFKRRAWSHSHRRWNRRNNQRGCSIWLAIMKRNSVQNCECKCCCAC